VARLRPFQLSFGIASCAALLGCGAGDHTESPSAADGVVQFQVSPDVNECPAFIQSLVIPQAIRPRFSAEAAVVVTDPDGPDSALEYTWSASSGSFTDPKQPTTRYGCEARGPQLLKLIAVDRPGCEARLTLRVDCLDE